MTTDFLTFYLGFGVYVLGLADGSGWDGVSSVRREIWRVRALLAWPVILIIGGRLKPAKPDATP